VGRLGIGRIVGEPAAQLVAKGRLPLAEGQVHGARRAYSYSYGCERLNRPRPAKGDEMATSAVEAQGADSDPMRFHRKAHAEAGTESENLYGDSFMERLAEKTASGMGTVQFVVIGSAIIVGWVLVNNAIPYAEETIKHLAKGKPFDPVPWILLNLIFSGVAFYTGALVIIAQKAEGKKNKVREEA